jgi:hypothetical protein
MAKKPIMLGLYLFLGFAVIQIPIVLGSPAGGPHSGAAAMLLIFYFVPLLLLGLLYERGLLTEHVDFTVLLVLVQSLLLTAVTLALIAVVRQIRRPRPGGAP